MALVNCRKCNYKVSDKSKKCINCGVDDPGVAYSIVCPEPECQSLNDIKNKECRICGYPFIEEDEGIDEYFEDDSENPTIICTCEECSNQYTYKFNDILSYMEQNPENSNQITCPYCYKSQKYRYFNYCPNCNYFTGFKPAGWDNIINDYAKIVIDGLNLKGSSILNVLESTFDSRPTCLGAQCSMCNYRGVPCPNCLVINPAKPNRSLISCNNCSTEFRIYW